MVPYPVFSCSYCLFCHFVLIDSNIKLFQYIFRGNVDQNGEVPKRKTDNNDETDFSMATLSKGEITQV